MAPLVFKALVIICGIIALVTGANDLWRGASVKSAFGDLGDYENTPMLNFTIRYYSVIWMSFGAFMILFVLNLQKYDTALMLAFGFVILGGLGRVMSLIKTGMPEAQHVSTVYSILAVELLLIPSLLIWLVVAAKDLKG